MIGTIAESKRYKYFMLRELAAVEALYNLLIYLNFK